MHFKSQTKIEALSGNALFLIDLFTSPANTSIIEPADSISDTDDSGACFSDASTYRVREKKPCVDKWGNAMKEISLAIADPIVAEPVRGDPGISVSAFCSPGVRLRVGLNPSELL